MGYEEAGEADGGEAGTDGGYGGQGGGEVPGIEVGERRDGEDAGLSDGDFDEDDLVLEDDGEDELDSKLKPDHRFFAVFGGGRQDGQEAQPPTQDAGGQRRRVLGEGR